MRSLSPTLLAAQQKPHRTPYIEATIYDYNQGISRPSWQRVYSGSEPAGQHGIAFDGRGNMHRIRFEQETFLYYQKQTLPFGVPAVFPLTFPIELNEPPALDQWELVSASCYGPCAIAASGSRVYIFYRRVTTNVIWKHYSHDYGQTWQNAQLDNYEDVVSMAAAWWGETSEVVCFVTRNGSNGGGSLLAASASPGMDGEPPEPQPAAIAAIVLNTDTQQDQTYEWTMPEHPMSQILGIGATFNPSGPSIDIIYSGRLVFSPEHANWDIFRSEFRANHRFSIHDKLVVATWIDQYILKYPDCHYPTSPQGYETTRVVYVEEFTGRSRYNRPLMARIVKGSTWLDSCITEPLPFLKAPGASKETEEAPFGLCIATTPDYWWLSKPDGVWRARREPPQPITITSEPAPGCIASLAASQYASTRFDHPSGTLVIELDNSEGTYASPGTGALASLRPGSEVMLKLGYRTPAGNEIVEAGTYWIDNWRYHSTPNRSLFTLYCLDGWGLLDRWVTRHTMQWNHVYEDYWLDLKSVWQILRQVLARVGIHLTNVPAKPQSSIITELHPPDFTVPRGTQGDTAPVIRLLLSLVPDHLVFRGQQAFTKDPRSTETPCYAYGDAHVVQRGEYTTPTNTTHARVTSWRCMQHGSNPYLIAADAFDWNLLSLGIDIYESASDAIHPNTSFAGQQASALLRHAALAAIRGTVVVPTNVGQELLDVVTITDRRVALDPTPYRIMAIFTCYDRHNATYEQKLALAAP